MVFAAFAKIESSGDKLTDRLRTVLFHSCGEITTEMSCVMASNIAEWLRDDNGDEDWGLRLSLSPSEDAPSLTFGTGPLPHD